MTHIYLEIKFAHRHDSPGCLEIKNHSIEIYKNMFYFKGYCVIGDIPIKFELNLELFQDVNKDESIWDFSSVGRFVVTLKKQMPNMYWDRLLRDQNEHVQNMKVWFEMRNKFEEELKSYMEEDEEEEFKRQTEEIIKNAKDKKKRKKAVKKAAAAAARAKEKQNQETNIPEEKGSEEL